MRFRIILTLVAILGSSLSMLSQTPKLEIYNWCSFQPANEEFKIETPSDLIQEGDNDAKSSRSYHSFINGVYIYVFSDSVKSPDNLKIIKRFVEGMGKPLDESKASESPTLLSFVDSFGYWQKISVIRTVSRIYVAQTASKDENDPLVKHFIHSFGLGTNRPFPPEIIELKPEDNPITPTITPLTPDTSQRGTGLGNGSGYGQGSGSGSGSGNGSGIGPATTNSVTHQTTTLKILSKPRPAYTDFARFYWISGTVLTRVTFLATGQIGAVTPMTKLPFGLTEQAVTAAKRLKFEPAYLDGKPVSVTKQVEYSFSIY